MRGSIRFAISTPATAIINVAVTYDIHRKHSTLFIID